MAVTLGTDLLVRYPRFSLYNSPYPAHDAGRAVDLYLDQRRDAPAPSPVAGEVVDTYSVRAPSKSYAPEQDHLITVAVDVEATPGLACASPVDADALVARIMHVDPAVAPGDRVEPGDTLGTTVRAGFFAPWVGDHLHVGFRHADQNQLRARGSLPLSVDAAVESLDWDGTGTVVETGETYAVLDSPAHPAPDERFVGIAADGGGVLDGGLRHYDGGGLLCDDENGDAASAGDAVSFLGTPVGAVSGTDTAGEVRTVDWGNVAVYANGTRVTGLSLFAAQDDGFGAKIVGDGHGLSVGDNVTVEIRETDDPTILESG
ncbi:hypothetical protein [Haloarchaeobius sp. TZWWS8]|uniref:hypothetical protein n=1 Tax=Haloarchaeobius sp. TZWWS8 TaxID=3446121 RepID=UPI003EBB3B5E